MDDKSTIHRMLITGEAMHKIYRGFGFEDDEGFKGGRIVEIHQNELETKVSARTNDVTKIFVQQDGGTTVYTESYNRKKVFKWDLELTTTVYPSKAVEKKINSDPPDELVGTLAQQERNEHLRLIREVMPLVEFVLATSSKPEEEVPVTAADEDKAIPRKPIIDMNDIIKDWSSSRQTVATDKGDTSPTKPAVDMDAIIKGWSSSRQNKPD